MFCYFSLLTTRLHYLGAPAGGAVGAGPPFGPRVGQDATEGAAAVGSASHAFDHIFRDAVLVIGHLSFGAAASQAEVEDGGHLATSPRLGGKGAGEEWVDGLREDEKMLAP